MSQEEIAAWGAFLSGLGTLIIAIVGTSILFYDVRLRRRQLRENHSRSYSALNVNFQVTCQLKPSANSAAPSQWILEARVTLKNVTSEILAVPAVYIYARAIPESSNFGDSQSFTEKDFSRLESVGQLSEPMNAAWFPASIWHLGPDEEDSVVRWDVLTEDFIERRRALIVRVLIFSIPNEFVGAAFSGGNPASLIRTEWTEFMEKDGGARHKKVIFSHAIEDVGSIKKGDWVLLQANSDGVDEEASWRFRRAIEHICQTGRQNLVVLGGVGINGPAATEANQHRAAPLLPPRESGSLDPKRSGAPKRGRS